VRTKSSWRLFAILGLVIPVALMPSCARPQQLTQIQIQPSGGFTFGAADPGLSGNFRAIGTYIHPPQTIDITNQVTWQSDIPQIVGVSTTGIVAPTGAGCGTGGVFAQMHQDGNDIVSNTANILINGPASAGCTPSGPLPILSVTFAGAGTGTVTSSPAGITCSSPSTCSATFTTGQTVTLTASATGGSTFVNWNGCSSAQGTLCTVIVEQNVGVTATFNP
jgi:hypothetical protein